MIGALLVSIGNDQGGSRCVEGPAGGLSDATGAAGYKGCLAFE
jgi:hypothetical protein